MTSARAALEGLGSLGASIRRGPTLPKDGTRPTQIMLRALDALAESAAGPPPDRIAAAVAVIRAAAAAGRQLRDLPARTLLDGAWAMWQRWDPAAAIPGFEDAAFAMAARHARMLRRLADVWLRNFDIKAPPVAAGRRIGRLILAADSPLLQDWRDAERDLALFDAAKGPAAIAAQLLGQDGTGILARCRLDSPLRAQGGYMRLVTMAVGEGAAVALGAGHGAAALDRALVFLAPGGRLRFDEPDMRVRMADALVSAWRSGRAPDDTARQKVLQFLRLHLSDPRVWPVPWNGVHKETLRIVRGWLAALSLDAFFRTIGRFAMESGFQLHWVRREAFWRACLEKGFIADGWVVVGDSVRTHLRGHAELDGSFGWITHGGDSNHSVLLMVIGQHVFAEWSHNGKLRVWKMADPSAPVMFHVGSYPAGELKARCLPFPAPRLRQDMLPTDRNGLSHIHPTWQQRVAEFLRVNEHLIIEEHEWQPKR